MDDDLEVHIATDYTQCKKLWNECIKKERITDLWEIRDCFHEQFNNEFYFIYVTRNKEVVGLLPLVQQKLGLYTYFPGENWKDKTWLEHNQIYAQSKEIYSKLLESIPINSYIRYLTQNGFMENLEIDEINYSFDSKNYDYNIDNYLNSFSSKSRQRINRDLRILNENKVEYFYDLPESFEKMIAMNVERYGEDSYFYDKRFQEAFRQMGIILKERNQLRYTTVMLNDEIAAIDMGIVYNGFYTLISGGTRSHFPGVAKLINWKHFVTSCENNLYADFMCGSFSWKELFHLKQTPLYKINKNPI
jgi:hypothetical protein